MAIKGFKKPVRIQYSYGKCGECGKMVTSGYLEQLILTPEDEDSAMKFVPCGMCKDCRADHYKVAPNMVWEYEKAHQDKLMGQKAEAK